MGGSVDALPDRSEDRPEDRCAVLVRTRNLSLSLSDKVARPCRSSSLLAAEPDRCSVLMRRRASMRSSTVACRSLARSKSRERLLDALRLEVLPASTASVPKGGASAFSSPTSSDSSCSGRRSRRLKLIRQSISVHIGAHNRGAANSPKWTSTRDIHQPRINTRWVELVIAWQDTNILSHCEIFSADRTAQAFIISDARLVPAAIAFSSRISRRVCRGIIACSQRTSGFKVADRLHRALGNCRQMALGAIVRCQSVGLRCDCGFVRDVLKLSVWIGFSRLCVAKLDNRQSFENGPSQPLCPALPGSPAKATARAVSLGISVGADGASGDDDQKEKSDETSDAVEDAHGHCGVVAALLAVLVLLHVGEVAANSCSCSACSARREISKLGGCGVVGHGQKLVEIQVLASKAAALFLLAI